jgi:hypothetical protein
LIFLKVFFIKKKTKKKKNKKQEQKTKTIKVEEDEEKHLDSIQLYREHFKKYIYLFEERCLLCSSIVIKEHKRKRILS